MVPRQSLPTISLAIGSLDRPVSLDRLLRTIWGQTYRPLEIIIVDSAGLPKERLENWQEQARNLGIDWVVRRLLTTRLTRLRNQAASAARGSIIQFLDEDMTLGSDYLESVARVFAAPHTANIGGVVGSIRDPLLADPLERWKKRGLAAAGWWAIRQRQRHWVRYPLPAHTVEFAYFAQPAAYRREVFRQFTYDETLDSVDLGEEQQFSLRVARQWRLVRSWEAIATRHHDPVGRPDWYLVGRRTVRNRLYTWRTAIPRGFGERLVSAWTITLGTACIAVTNLIRRSPKGRDLLRGMIREYLDQLLQLLVPQPLREALRKPMPIGPPDVRGLAFLLPSFQNEPAVEAVLAMAEKLKAGGHRPHLWALHGGGTLVRKVLAAGIPVRLGLQRDRLDPSCAVRLAGYCRRAEVDTLVAVGGPGEVLTWGVLSRLYHRHRVAWWNVDHEIAPQWLARWFGRRFLQYVQTVLADGHEQAQEFSLEMKLPRERICILSTSVERQAEEFLTACPKKDK